MKHAAFAMLCIASTIFAPSVEAATPKAGATTHSPAVADFSGAGFERKSGPHDFISEYSDDIAQLPQLATYLEAERATQYRRWQDDIEAVTESRERGDLYGDVSHQVRWHIEAQGGKLYNIISDIAVQAGGSHGLFRTESIIWDDARKQVLADPRLLFSDKLESVADQYYRALEAERIRSSGGEWQAYAKTSSTQRPPFGALQFSLTGSDTAADQFDMISIIANPEVAGPFGMGTIIIKIPVTDDILKTVKPEYRAFFVPADGEQSSARNAVSNPNYAMSSFALRDKAGNRQLHMISPMEANTGSNMEELCIPGSRICLSIVSRHEEIDCKADSDVCDRIPVTTGEVPMTLRVRENFAGNEQVPNEIHYIPLNINVVDPLAVILWPLVTISANAPMTQHTPGGVTIGVISMKDTPSGDGFAGVQRFHLLRLDELGSHEVTATEILSAVKSLQLCRKVSAADHPEGCRIERGAMGMLALDMENTDPSPAYEYFLGGGTVGSLTTMLAEMETIEKLSDLHGKDIIKPDQCYVMRRLAMAPLSGRYEFDSPLPDCRFLSVTD